MRHERAHLDVRQRPVLLAVPRDVPLNLVDLSGHDRFFAHAGLVGPNLSTVRPRAGPHCSYAIARVNRAIVRSTAASTV